MKITLEFKNMMEHNKYCIEQTKLLMEKDISVAKQFDGKPIQVNTRRKTWSQYELEFIKENYMSKKVRWIALQLGRPVHAVQMKLNKMYKEGLQKKRPRNGKVREE